MCAWRMFWGTLAFVKKGISKGTERRNCSFTCIYSTFHRGVKGLQRMTSTSVKTPDYSKKMTPYKSKSQGEQNGANFSFIEPSSEE